MLLVSLGVLCSCGSSPKTAPQPDINASNEVTNEATPATAPEVTSAITTPEQDPVPAATMPAVTSAIQAQLEAGPAIPPPSAGVDGSTDGYAAGPVEATPTYTGPVREAVTSGQICAAALAMLFGRDPSTMTIVSDSARLARVKYMRSDQTTWTNECRLTDRTVTWRAIGADGPGRWRTEDVITYTASTAGLAMTVNGETRAFAR